MTAVIEERLITDWIQDTFKRQKQNLPALRVESIAARKTRLKKLRQWVLAHRPLLRKALYDDFKKPAAEVDAIEVFTVVNEIGFALANLNRWTKPQKVDAPLSMMGTRSYVMAEPKGVCLIIAPWNSF